MLFILAAIVAIMACVKGILSKNRKMFYVSLVAVAIAMNPITNLNYDVLCIALPTFILDIVMLAR